jgi:outer membrane protein OmpA-like peptidoglycan-associated protein
MSNAGPESPHRTGAVAATPGQRRRPLWLWLLLLFVALLLLAWLLYALLHKSDSGKTDAAKPVVTASASSLPGSSQTSTSPNGVSGSTAFGAALVGGGGVAPRAATGVEAAPGRSTATAGGASSAGAEATTATVPQGTVLFASGSAAIDAAGLQVIQAAATRIQALHPSTVTVTGYTDVVGGQPKNANLSQRRADAVAAVLRRDLGAAAAPAITAIARGEADPIAPNTTPSGRQQNRRASITTSG